MRQQMKGGPKRPTAVPDGRSKAAGSLEQLFADLQAIEALKGRYDDKVRT